MLEAMETIDTYLKNYTKKSFLEDKKTQDAVIRQLEIIGEAAGKIPPNIVTDSPISWKRITGLRHKLIHDYFGVDLEIVWKTALKGLKPLKRYVSNKVKKA